VRGLDVGGVEQTGHLRDEEGVRPRGEQLRVVDGEPEEPGDGPRRQRSREPGDQVGGRAAVGNSPDSSCSASAATTGSRTCTRRAVNARAIGARNRRCCVPSLLTMEYRHSGPSAGYTANAAAGRWSAGR
jgi:hypothetical protein